VANPAPPLPALDAHLQKLAEHARDSKESFDAFAAAVHKVLPQVDRLCLTAYSGGKLRVQRVSYPGDVAKHVMPAGFEGNSKAYALGFFALLGGYFNMTDLSKAQAADLGYLGKTLSSSAHVGIVLDGDPATLNFWSKEKNAFPESAHLLLKAIAQAVAAGGRQTAAAGR
jgi:hypothetical protein